MGGMLRAAFEGPRVRGLTPDIFVPRKLLSSRIMWIVTPKNAALALGTLDYMIDGLNFYCCSGWWAL